MSRTTLSGTWLRAAIAATALGMLTCGSPRAALDDRRGGPPDASLITHHGKRIRFREQVEGQVVLLNFMYTKCKGSCPGTTATLLKVQKQLGDHLGRDVFIYSVSLD